MRCTARGGCLALALWLAAASPPWPRPRSSARSRQGQGRARCAARGVTVIVTSPALQGEQAELTDVDGYYVVTNSRPARTSCASSTGT